MPNEQTPNRRPPARGPTLGDALAAAVHASADAVVVTDLDLTITYVNPAFESMTGYTAAEAVGRSPRLWASPETPPSIHADIRRALLAGERWSGRLRNRRKPDPGVPPDADPAAGDYWCELTISPIVGDSGAPTGYVSVQRNAELNVARERDLRTRRDAAELMLDVAAALQQARPFEDTARAALDALLARLPVPHKGRASLFVRDPLHGGYRLAARIGGRFNARWSDDDAFRALDRRLACFDESLLPLAYDADEPDDGPSAPGDECAGGHYLVPLAASGEIIGLLTICAARKPDRSLATLDLLQRTGQLFAGALVAEEAAQRLRAAHDAAVAAEQAKAHFLANVSHEIRTPMTAIMGFLDLLDDPMIEPRDRESHLLTVRRNGSHLLSLINDLLVMAKGETDALEMHPTACRPRELASCVLETLRVRAEQRGLSLELRASPRVPDAVRLDEYRLRQILLNLAENAVKFSSDGVVRVGLDYDAGMLVATVRDTGCGIDERELSRVFEPFHQGDASHARRAGGVGLGLSICHRIAQRMGGRIDVSSQPGVGSTFTARVHAPLDARDRPETTHADAGPAGDDASPVRDRRVLVVEDGPDNQRLLRFFLERAGARVELADNGALALDAVRAADLDDPFALVLMDMQMPVMDGYEATRQLRARGCFTPVLALTAHALEYDRGKCLDAGCDDYATKPIDGRDLVTLCGRWLDKRHAPAHRAA